MNTNRNIHQQNIFDSTGLLPKRNCKTALWHIALLALVVFLTEISTAQADMVFDFQMKLAQKGNAEAQYKVGEMYESGRGVAKNQIEAMRWINKAAAQGHQAAGYKLLYYDLKKTGVTAANKPKLIDLQNAAKAGDGYAQYYVGLMHSRGVGLRRNSTVALDWLNKASLVGVTAAEAEIVRVNEARQNAQRRARQQADQKAREDEARRQEEERKQVEAQREAEKRKQQDAAARKKADQDKKLAKQREAERKAAEKEAKRQKLIAQREAEAEQKRKAVMEQRKKKEKEKQAQFESDPCAGKSARFLSTCR